MYWISTGHFDGVRGQIFLKRPDEFDEHQKNARVVDWRYKPKDRIK